MLLSETSGGVSIISFPSVIEASAGTANATFTLLFSLMTRIIKENIKHDKGKQNEETQ